MKEFLLYSFFLSELLERITHTNFVILPIIVEVRTEIARMIAVGDSPYNISGVLEINSLVWLFCVEIVP